MLPSHKLDIEPSLSHLFSKQHESVHSAITGEVVDANKFMFYQADVFILFFQIIHRPVKKSDEVLSSEVP